MDCKRSDCFTCPSQDYCSSAASDDDDEIYNAFGDKFNDDGESYSELNFG